MVGWMIRLLRRYVGQSQHIWVSFASGCRFDMAMKHAQFHRVNDQHKGHSRREVTAGWEPHLESTAPSAPVELVCLCSGASIVQPDLNLVVLAVEYTRHPGLCGSGVPYSASLH